jgi:hypothetical protein
MKSYAPFIELTRTDEVPGLATISLVNIDDIILVRCLDDGKARVYFRAEPRLSQWIDPVENYAYLVSILTDLTATAQPAE